jgi:hypothetical protein
MRNQKLLLFFLCLKLYTLSAQQLYPIQDTAFLRFLKDKYPACVVHDSLDKAQAHLVTGFFTINNPIWAEPQYLPKSIDGLQFFDRINYCQILYCPLLFFPHLVSDSIQALDIHASKLRIMSALDSLPNLMRLQIDNSLLRSLPSLDRLPKLIHLYVGSSPIDSLPALDSLSHLHFLFTNYLGRDCYYDSCPRVSLFHKLPSLRHNKELLIWQCFSSYLDTLEEMDSFPYLVYVGFFYNKIRHFPTMYAPRLVDVFLPGNQISDIPDFSGAPGINQLILADNYIPAFPILSPLDTILNIDLSGNEIRYIPPYLPPRYHDSLMQIDFSRNRLDFGDAYHLLTYNDRLYVNPSRKNFLDAGTFDTVGYLFTNQKPFGYRDTVTVLTYGDTVLTIAAQQYADSYQWYKDSVPIAGATDTALHIYVATPADAGSYTCHSIGQYFNTHGFRFNYGITEFGSEPQLLRVDPRQSITNNLATLYPSLSDGHLTLKYALHTPQAVYVKVYSITGALVSSLTIPERAHGQYYEPIYLDELAAGAYFARVDYSGGYNKTVRLVIVK